MTATLKVLEEIVHGGVVTKECAERLVTSILEEFPDADDDERFEELLHILASYNPLGGERILRQRRTCEGGRGECSCY